MTCVKQQQKTGKNKKNMKKKWNRDARISKSMRQDMFGEFLLCVSPIESRYDYEIV